MSQTYNAIYNDGSIDFPFAVTSDLTVNKDRDYVQTPIFSGAGSYIIYDGTSLETFTSQYSSGTLTEYDYIFEGVDHLFSCTNPNAVIQNSASIPDLGESYTTTGSIVFPFSVVYSNAGNYGMTVMSNIPIFLYSERQYALIYSDSSKTLEERNQALTHAFNYLSGEVEPEGKRFNISNPWQHGTWSEYGPSPDTPVAYRNVRGKILGSGKVAFYPIGLDDGSLKMGMKTQAVFSALEYSTDGVTWHDTENFPFEFFYLVRTNEIGTFNYGLAFGNDLIPEFENENDADDFIEGNKPITEATNWPQIGPNYPEENVPGDPDAQTEFGEVGARSIFSQQYVVPLAVMYEIANTFYDTTTAGLWDDIKKGLQMYGDSPIECIENLSYYACDISSIYPGASQNHIYFGGYKMDFQQGSVYRIANPNGSKDLGSFFCNRKHGNWLDFEPYTKLFVGIPYCGMYQLDLSECYNKTISFKYFIDTRTCSCICVVLANGHEIERYNGQIGVQMPIKLTDFSAYANAQINTLLGGGGQALTQGGQIAGNAAQAAGAGAASAGMLAGAAGLAVGLGGIMGAKTVYGLAQNNINRFSKTKGGSTSMLNMCMPQTITMTWEFNEPDIPSNFYQLNGYPSNAGGRIGNFTGFLKCDSIKVSMPGATDTELEKAKALLLNGVYL